MENFYHLTKKELSFISSVDAPLTCGNARLSQPVVVVLSKIDHSLISVYTLKWFKHLVSISSISDLFEYHIKAMF